MADRVNYAHATTCRRYRRIPSLVPPSSAIPTAAEKQQYDDDDDQKGCVIHIVLLSGDDRTAGNNKCGRTYFVAYRVNYVQAITSQERQGAGFVDSVAGSPLFTIAVTLCFREHSYRARRIAHLHDECSRPVSREILPWLKFWKAVASSLKSRR
jgi:hypothetical protein